ncbi:MAG: hypothetical protein HQL76_14055 [Magnetococcales bacterium]|nr:hypothetical protein [Magnetococcales bacterium]
MHTGSSDRAFGVVFTLFFLLVFLFPLLNQEPVNSWALIPATLFALLTWLRPALLHPLNLVWTRIGLLLHHVTTPILMSLIFFLTVTPIALLMRLFGKRPLALEFSPDRDSYWMPRKTPDPDSMKQQF